MGIGEAILPDPEESPEARLFFGKSGIQSAAPIGAIGSLVTGDLISPPVVQSFKNLAKAGAQIEWDDPASIEKAGKAAGKTIVPFTPAGVILRMIDRDLPMYFGEEPGK